MMHPTTARDEDGITEGRDMAIVRRSADYGALQRVIDASYRSTGRVSRLDLIIQCEAADLPGDLIEIVTLLPPGTYTRQQLCDQLNSSLAGHGWGLVYGTVE